MSQENVEMVRRLLDAWNRRDLDAMLDLGGSELVYVNSPTAVEPGTRRGRDEVEEVARKQWEILAERLEHGGIEAAVGLRHAGERCPNRGTPARLVPVPRWQNHPGRSARLWQSRSPRSSRSRRP